MRTVSPFFSENETEKTERNGKTRKEMEQKEEMEKKNTTKTERKQGKKGEKTEEKGKKKKGKIGNDTVPATPFAKSRFEGAPRTSGISRQKSLLPAIVCADPLSRYTWRATRVAADFSSASWGFSGVAAVSP